MKHLKRVLLLILVAGLSYGVYYAWRALPILTGYGAKNLCSCVMLAGRPAEQVIREELGGSPLSYGTFAINYEDSSATGSIFGLAKRKAIFRKGLGCTLVSGISEQVVRNQKPKLPKPPSILQDTVPWPIGDKLDQTLPDGINQEIINSAVEEAFLEPGPTKTRRTRAILILYDGKIIAEKYGNGYDTNSLLTAWSMTKSITNALVGILVKEGKLKIDEPAPVQAWSGDNRKNISLDNLMHANSGLKWVEFYGGPSDVTDMLFTEPDAGYYAAAAPMQYAPGKVFYYSSGTTNILSRIIREKTGDNYYKFPYERLFYKLGMFNTTLEPDARGTFVGSSFCFATARDFARFGLLYLNDGVWNGERILPDGWVKYTTTPSPGAALGEYGAQFWLNAGAPGNPANRVYPDVPADAYWAEGFEGQNIFIIPSKKLVVVKLSLSSRNEGLDDNKFLAQIVKAVE